MLKPFRTATLLILTAASCHSATARSPEPSSQTRAKIENRASLDMDISVRRSDGRLSRLGLAPGGETTTFALAPSITAGAAWIRFEAKPVRTSGRAEVSEPFPVHPGDEIVWSVPPQ